VRSQHIIQVAFEQRPLTWRPCVWSR
jgi:hypothetical protein